MDEEKKEFETNSQNVSPEDQTSEKGDVTSDNSDNLDNSDKEKENKDESEKTDKYSASEKQLYERAKKAEAKAKRLEYLEKKVEDQNKSSDSADIPTEQLAKTVHALKDYSPDEVDTIFKQAKSLGVSPLEALKDEDVTLLINAKREKVAKESKTPEPTNRQTSEEKSFSEWTSKDIEGKSLEEISKYYDWIKKQS